MAFKLQPNIAENRAIHASEERGVSVPLAGSMRPLRQGMLTAPKMSALHVPTPKPPKPPVISGAPHIAGRRKYYGEP